MFRAIAKNIAARTLLKFIKYFATVQDKEIPPLWDAPNDLSGNNRTVIKLYKEAGHPWSYV